MTNWLMCFYRCLQGRDMLELGITKKGQPRTLPIIVGVMGRVAEPKALKYYATLVFAAFAPSEFFHRVVVLDLVFGRAVL